MRNTMKVTNEQYEIGMDQESMTEGASQVAVGVLMTLAGLIGAWGVACLIGGIVKTGGLLEMARGWITAITGM